MRLACRSRVGAGLCAPVFHRFQMRRAFSQKRRDFSVVLHPSSRAWVAATHVESPASGELASVQTGQSLPHMTRSHPKDWITCSA
ncbi:Uncharacterised protein [Brucella ovis]|nr:Uncharacterised protein [Brucella ovis]